MKRVFLIVLDSFGIGSAPDARLFGDEGANTLISISKSEKFNIPNLTKLGLCNIEGVTLSETISPTAAYGRLCERSNGKDTTTGHWEIAGIISDNPMPTFPDGFPECVINEFKRLTGRGVLCNKTYSGTQVINDYGKEHLETGSLIVYTSADSVFQIASHTDIVPLDELYDICKRAREMLTGEFAVGRVIARPFTGKVGNFTRTADRRDFSLPPTSETMLDRLQKKGKKVISVGKIYDIFAGKGIDESNITHSNSEGMQKTLDITERDFNGLCFVNLVDFDMLYGHRNDMDGYANAISEFDKWLPKFISKLKPDDVMIITADHGCDPCDDSTDHTREYVPLLIYGEKVTPKNLGTLNGFDNISKFILENIE